MRPKRTKSDYVKGSLVGLGIVVAIVAMKGGAFVDYLWVIGGSVACLTCVGFVAYQNRGNLSVPRLNWPCIWALSNVAAALFGFILLYEKVADPDHFHARQIPYMVFTAVSVWFNIGSAPVAKTAESGA